MRKGWRAALWWVKNGPVQTPAPRDPDVELTSAPEASLSSPVKWGQRHLPGRDRTKALSAIQARKGGETALLLPFRSRRPAASSCGKPSRLYSPLGFHGMSPKLHTPMYFLLSHLSFVDFCYSTTVTAKLLENLVVEDRTISFTGCIMQFSLACMFEVAETFMLAVMAYY